MKLREVSKYVTEIEVGIAAGAMSFNKNFWEGLPADIQKTLNDLVPYMDKLFTNSYVNGYTAVKNKIKKLGKPEFVTPPPAAMNEGKKVGLSIWDEWAEEMEKQGLSGKMALAEFERLLKSYGVSLPGR